MTIRQILPCATLALLLAAASGCGHPEAKVTGRVTLDGEPVQDGTILFTPKDGKGQAASGEIKGGQFTATKVTPGVNKVQINGKKSKGKIKPYKDSDTEIEEFEELIPAEYNLNSTLEVEIKAGDNDLKPFELAKKK
jgi:hypothetical protein